MPESTQPELSDRLIAAGTYTDWWLYLIAPIIGGLLAGGLYRGVLVQTRSTTAMAS